MDYKYIKLLLERCLNFDKSKSLFIHYDKINYDFVKKVEEYAKKIGINDIYLHEEDVNLEHDILSKISLDEIENHEYFNSSIWDEYAKKGANFLLLETEFPKIMDDIDPKKIARASFVKRNTKPLYKEKQGKGEIPWCIAALANKYWAEDIFKEEDSYKKLENVIYKMCMVDKEDPVKAWDEYLEKTKKIGKKLNDLNIKSLHYTNSLGTDLKVYYNNPIWCSAASEDNIICNMPSYEIFTSPNYMMTEGIVYNSKPLIFNGGMVDKFYIEFRDGRAVKYDAKVGFDILKEIIESDSNSGYLGETALVNYDSPISNTHLVFGTTLFDENASCHLALGTGFRECVKDGFEMDIEQLKKEGINQSIVHVDFMIGTPDLKIVADTNIGSVTIFENGNFTI